MPMLLDKADAAVVHKLAWRNPVMCRYATALVAAGLELYQRGISFFNNDDVADCDQPGDGTTVGSAVRMLCHEGVIAPFRGTVDCLHIHGGMRRSSRACNNGHRNQLYRIVNRGIAEKWLEVHGHVTKPRQMALFE